MNLQVQFCRCRILCRCPPVLQRPQFMIHRHIRSFSVLIHKDLLTHSRRLLSLLCNLAQEVFFRRLNMELHPVHFQQLTLWKNSILKWVPGTTVSKCYGCGNKIENPPQALPDDLIIVFRATREYRDRITGQLQTSNSPQNVHFHLRAACVSKRYPHFQPGLLNVQPHFIRLLRPEHFQRLFCEIGWVYNP